MHLMMLSTFRHWWAGHSYGARFFTDMIPFFMMLWIAQLKREPFAFKNVNSKLLFALAVLWGLLIHANGAWNHGADQWNGTPVSVDHDPKRIWDWQDPQFLRMYREDAEDL